MSNSEQIAFLPTMNETIMDELRTTEGMLFRDENVKKLFLDTKELVLESLLAAYKNFKGEMYQSVLDKYSNWETYVEAEEVARMKFKFKDMETRLVPVVVSYAKFLFNQDEVVNIKKPKIETFLKAMFVRLSKSQFVRNSSFFEMDPLKQDFVIRDIFRQALSNDCLNVVMKQAIHVIEEEEEEEAGNLLEKKEFNEEVYPEDSISVLMEKKETETEKIVKLNEQKFSYSRKPLEKKEEEDDNKSTLSRASRTSKSTCKVPTVKKVHIDNEDVPSSS